MKCPMSFQIDHDNDYGIEYHSDECMGDECQWWVSRDADCTIKALTYQLGLLTNIMREIRQIMPERTLFLK